MSFLSEGFFFIYMYMSILEVTPVVESALQICTKHLKKIILHVS